MAADVAEQRGDICLEQAELLAFSLGSEADV